MASDEAIILTDVYASSMRFYYDSFCFSGKELTICYGIFLFGKWNEVISDLALSI